MILKPVKGGYLGCISSYQTPKVGLTELIMELGRNIWIDT